MPYKVPTVDAQLMPYKVPTVDAQLMPYKVPTVEIRRGKSKNWLSFKHERHNALFRLFQYSTCFLHVSDGLKYLIICITAMIINCE